MYFYNFMKCLVISIAMISTCLSSPVTVYVSETSGAGGIRLVTGKIYWNANPSLDRPVEAVNNSYFVGPVYLSTYNWWEGTPASGLYLDCRGYTYQGCGEEWIKRFGKVTTFTLGVNNKITDVCLGFGVGLRQSNYKSPFPDSACSNIPPKNISCSVNVDDLHLNFPGLESNKYDGASLEQPMKVKCSGGDASVSVLMDSWNLALSNGTSASFTISAEGTVINSNGHLFKLNGERGVVLKTVLHGTPRVGGAFRGSTFLIFNYD